MPRAGTPGRRQGRRGEQGDGDGWSSSDGQGKKVDRRQSRGSGGLREPSRGDQIVAALVVGVYVVLIGGLIGLVGGVAMASGVGAVWLGVTGEVMPMTLVGVVTTGGMIGGVGFFTYEVMRF